MCEHLKIIEVGEKLKSDTNEDEVITCISYYSHSITFTQNEKGSEKVHFWKEIESLRPKCWLPLKQFGTNGETVEPLLKCDVKQYTINFSLLTKNLGKLSWALYQTFLEPSSISPQQFFLGNSL